MNAIRKNLEDLRTSRDLIAHIKDRLAAAAKSTPDSANAPAERAVSSAATLLVAVDRWIVQAEAECRAVEREVFGDAPILQVPFSCGKKRTVKIVVARPDTRCDEPHISQVQFDGVCRLLDAADPAKVCAQAKFGVAVIDHLGFLVASVSADGTAFPNAARPKK